MKKADRFDRIFEGLLWIGLVCFVFAVFITNLFHFNYKMNADIASEAVLGRLIWETGQILPDGWYGSNEVRILCAPNIAALFYGVTHNMNLSMGLACCVMTLLVLFSIAAFCRFIGMGRRYSLLMTFLCLMIPGSFVSLELTCLFASYYAIHVVVLFFTLGVYGDFAESGKGRIGCLILCVLLSLCLGVQGVRGILVIYGPLCGMEALRHLYLSYSGRRRRKADFMISLWVLSLFFFSVLGTLAPVSIGQGFSRNIRHGLQKLFTVVLPDMGRAVGFTSTGLVGKLCLGILILAAVYILGEILVRMLRKERIRVGEWIYLILCSSPVLTALIVAFTTIDSSERYYFILIFVMAYAVVLLCMRSSQRVQTALAVLILILAVVNFSGIYLPVFCSEEPAETELAEAVRFLREKGYESGYASFENANTMTAISNAALRIAPVASVSKMDICKWLSSADWYVPNVPIDEITAYIITEAEREEFLELVAVKGEDAFRLLTKIGKYYIYASPYNFSTLGS